MDSAASLAYWAPRERLIRHLLPASRRRTKNEATFIIIDTDPSRRPEWARRGRGAAAQDPEDRIFARTVRLDPIADVSVTKVRCLA